MAFLSTATNLTPDDGDDDKDLFVKDMVRDQIVRVPGLPDEHRLENFALSDDGETLAVTMQDRQSGTTAITETVWTVTNPFLQNTAWRLWNPETQSHVYTIDMPERAQAIAGGWVLDGPAFLAGLQRWIQGPPSGASSTPAPAPTSTPPTKPRSNGWRTPCPTTGWRAWPSWPIPPPPTTPPPPFTASGAPSGRRISTPRRRTSGDYMLDAYGETYMLEGSAFWTEV